MLVAIVYPLIDGGFSQIAQVYRGLTSRGGLSYDEPKQKQTGAASTSASASLSEQSENKDAR